MSTTVSGVRGTSEGGIRKVTPGCRNASPLKSLTQIGIGNFSRKSNLVGRRMPRYQRPVRRRLEHRLRNKLLFISVSTSSARRTMPVPCHPHCDSVRGRVHHRPLLFLPFIKRPHQGVLKNRELILLVKTIEKFLNQCEGDPSTTHLMGLNTGANLVAT